MQLLEREVDHVELVNHGLQADKLVWDEPVDQLGTFLYLAYLVLECFVRFLLLTVFGT